MYFPQIRWGCVLQEKSAEDCREKIQNIADPIFLQFSG